MEHSCKPEPKPLLTLDEALLEFPHECATVLDPDGWSDYELTEHSGLHAPRPCGTKEVFEPPDYGRSSFTKMTIYLREGDLIRAILRWLAGKPMSDKTRCALVAAGDATHWQGWPRDMLRILLEEVSEHLKLEKKDAGTTNP